MDERIRLLRRELGLTQQAFSEKVGVKRNTIAQYEIGRNPPTDTVVTLMCREFGVSEDWLRNGTGPMFVARTRDRELGDFFAKVMLEDGFKARLLAVLSRLDTDQWAMLEELAWKLVDELDASKGPDDRRQEIDAEKMSPDQ